MSEDNSDGQLEDEFEKDLDDLDEDEDFHNPDFVKFAAFDQGFVDISRNRSLGFLLLLHKILFINWSSCYC
jgi:hypothetical protein